MATALWWVRRLTDVLIRDMRLADNRALTAVLSHAGQVIPVFVLDPLLLAAPDAGPQRVAFLLGGLKMPPDGQRAAGCLVGRDYPAPIVEHACAREQALAAYRTKKPGFLPTPGDRP